MKLRMAVIAPLLVALIMLAYAAPWARSQDPIDPCVTPTPTPTVTPTPEPAKTGLAGAVVDLSWGISETEAARTYTELDQRLFVLALAGGLWKLVGGHTTPPSLRSMTILLDVLRLLGNVWSSTWLIHQAGLTVGKAPTFLLQMLIRSSRFLRLWLIDIDRWV
jgi:hypothetical protein